MKKLIILGLSILTLSFSTFAQEKSKGQQKQDEKANRNKTEDTQEKGHAYGKNKGDLSGKEFGQQRSSEARAAALSKKEEVEHKIKSQEKQIEDNENKIKQAKEKIQKEEEKGKISSKDSKIKKEKIARAEEKVEEMKVLVEKEKRELSELANALEE